MGRPLACGVVMVSLLVWGACSKKESDDNGVGPTEKLSVTARLIEYRAVRDSITFDLADMSTVDFEGQQAIPLVDFVPTELIPPYDNKTPDDASDDVDRRPLYAYRIIASDGYNVHDNKGLADQLWPELEAGYILQETPRAVFDPSLGLSSSYSVRDVVTIDIYRKVDITTAEGSTFSELSDVASTTFDEQPALRLADLLAEMETPQTYQYNIVGVDDFRGRSPFSWEEIQTGYWLLDADRTVFDPDLGGQSKISNVRVIEVEAL